MARLDYIRDPGEIYRRSFEGIEAEAGLHSLPEAMRPVALRLVHACGMPDLVADLAFSEGAAEAGIAALAAGAPILCDVEMVRSGIIRDRLPATNEVICTLNDAGVAERASATGQTRSAAAVEFWGDRLAGAVVAIGNAPTALFRLLEFLDEGAPKPALVIGMPVGFVGAAESKAELASNPRGCAFIAIRGRRGGSAMAAAAVNALARPGR
jgi:precorrin-8X/cobalt-precorrin-8 methylmutase